MTQTEASSAPLSSIRHGEVGGIVRVIHGIHSLSVGVAGKTVSEAREALRQALNISPRAVALVDGQEVDEGQRLLPGQHLEFVRMAGEKG